ncbi:MAG TPA: Fe-S cluster assembly protein SufB [Usitatibacteraceae bacterium]|nr:Fe-S cluster assembly protein SufB [Usitatibacteraceae bacterium]
MSRMETAADRRPDRGKNMALAATALDELVNREYRHGFVTDVESDTLARGLDEEVIRLISRKKEEPDFMLEWRLKAFRRWLTMTEPAWASVHHPPIDYQDIIYYSAPRSMKAGPASLDDVDPELLRTYEKLGVPLKEREMLAGVAVDAVFDSVSVGTTYKAKLAELGIIFCSFSEAVREHPDLVRRYLGSVVPHTDNFFAALNAAVFTDGSFCYVPPGVRCPMELSTYFRINAKNTGQFERTLIIADEGAQVSYLEGCTAPMRDENQLHAAVVELIALDNARIKYSTVQNWYPGDKEGKGGIYNFVTKRGDCRGANSHISWTQVETGSAITWKYPSCILRGDNSVGEFHSVALTNNHQQADTGSKMIHIGRNTRSTIVSKGISAGRGRNAYRGLVKIAKAAEGARNFTRCDSLLLGDRCAAHTFPYIEVRNPTAKVEHEASTSRIGEDQLFYCMQRGISAEDAVSMIVNGFCKEVLKELPMEFAVEAQKLLGVSLEGAVG